MQQDRFLGGPVELNMIPFLGPADRFPPVQQALDEPDGLLAAGGDLSVERLVEAYRHGIFPWFSAGDPVLWWSPDPRTVLAPGALHVSRSLAKRLRKHDYRVTADTAFARVLDACAAPRRGDSGTWLLPEMHRAYLAMHHAGLAHSIEVWVGGDLAGGVYGVSIGRMFFGESMFSRHRDGSKIALAHLAAQLERWGFPLIDCQMETDHLLSLGAMSMPRRQFVAEVARLVQDPAPDWTSFGQTPPHRDD
jgi:leucyl/phenylalanyl-tRNA--protein transferase